MLLSCWTTCKRLPFCPVGGWSHPQGVVYKAGARLGCSGAMNGTWWTSFHSGCMNEFGNTTVGSHLSELQLSEHVGYSNVFSKAAPTISGYFCWCEAGLSSVSGLALLVVWQLKTQDNFYGQGRLCNIGESNCQTHTAGLPHEMETEQRLTVVCILALATYAVSSSSLAEL